MCGFSSKMSVSLIVLVALCASNVLAGWWEITTVDDTEYCTENSLAVVNGQPAIAYSTTGFHLRYAKFNGGNWEVTTVPGVATSSGVSLAEFAGQPAIAYGSRGYMRFTGSIWETNGYPGPDGVSPSLVQAGGQPAIAYKGIVNGFLQYARYDGETWSNLTVDNVHLQEGPSLKLVAGQPAIAYPVDVTPADPPPYSSSMLKYARYNGSTWEITSVDDTQSIAMSVSLAVVDSQPAIAYLDTQSGTLSYVRYDGDTWVNETVDNAAWGSRLSLAEIGGRPAIAYRDYDSTYIKYAEFDGSDWIISMVAPGANPDLAIVEGLPVISYTAVADGYLRSASYVPEPATLGFLLVGALLLQRRSNSWN